MSEEQHAQGKQPYRPPMLEEWGSVADLTACGRTRDGNDAKEGSVLRCQAVDA